MQLASEVACDGAGQRPISPKPREGLGGCMTQGEGGHDKRGMYSVSGGIIGAAYRREEQFKFSCGVRFLGRLLSTKA